VIGDLVNDIDSAEELFALLGVPADPATLAIHRLHILKVFGEAAAAIDGRAPAPQETERRALYAAALRAAHDRFVGGAGPRADQVFRGLAPDQGALVTLSRSGGSAAPAPPGEARRVPSPSGTRTGS